ncbi:MAG TPA: FecR domain-containing protein [Puia sp.]|nr:FecR domain-containing protein [Puia sp.]
MLPRFGGFLHSSCPVYIQNIMGKEIIWNLIAKKLSGEASEEELSMLESLLHSNPDLHYPMQTITDLWHSNQSPASEEALEAYGRHIGAMQKLGIHFPDENINPARAPKKNKRKIFFLSAGIVLLFSIFFAARLLVPAAGKPITNSEISTRNGSRTKLLLPDGSQVWLNAGSKLSYNKNYGSSLREVNLSGEAFFDVQKNTEKPFIIYTGKMQIKVLGTAFNVKSYPGEKTMETSLIRGSIEVTLKDRPSEKLILRPNEKIVVSNEEEPLITPGKAAAKPANEPMVSISHLSYLKSDSSIVETAWMQNKLVFTDKSFKVLAQEMERWYGMTIRFDDSQRDTLHFTGSFENETIQQALDALQLTTGKPGGGFHYKMQRNEIMILK